MSDRIRVVIIDDHTIVREGLRALLETSTHIDVVGEAADGAQGVELVKRCTPDVVLMDIRMPGMDGVTATREILQRVPDQAVIILTTFDGDEHILSAIRAGARGYVLKDMNRDVLFRSIEAAARGDTLLTPDIMERFIRATGTRAVSPGRSANPSPLSTREAEVLNAIADGLTSKAVGERLSISERTVKAHLTHVFDKFGVDTRAAAIAFAAERGWLDQTQEEQ